LSRPLRIAHRGGTGLWPENTLEAFERAIELGVDGIELDVHLSADGKLVVHHDERLNPSIARGPDGGWLDMPTPLVKDLTVEELGEYDVGRLRPGSDYGARHPEQIAIDGARIPLLEDVYLLAKAQASPEVRLYVELKTSLLDFSQSADPKALAEAAVALTRQMEMSDAVTFVSFDWRALVRGKVLAPEIPNAFTTLPFSLLAPEDPSARNDPPDSDRALVRQASSARAPWFAGFDWQKHPGKTFAERMLRAMVVGPADGWFAWHGDVSQETVSLARELKLEISCWTVDDPSEMSRLASLGVDAILTDRPDRFT
jgi:glycerophosphoryl diester phosphodiesterase